MYLRLAALLLLISFFPKDVPAQSPSGSSTAHYVCTFAKLKDRFEQGNYVTVRSGPSAGFKRIDQLHSGRQVYERRDWFKIFYSAPDGPLWSNVRQWFGCSEHKRVPIWMDREKVD